MNTAKYAVLTPPHPVYLISDLHLDASRADLRRAFAAFVESNLKDAQSLIILGDFFESWIGDDDHARQWKGIRRTLRELSERGVSLYFMHGNRDFLVGKDLAGELGLTLLDDPSVVKLAGDPTLLLHGDSLCTDDVAYQAFRTRSRTPEWRHNILSRPLWQRRLYARYLRLRSRLAQRNKSAEIVDVNADAVSECFVNHPNATRMIHGHTHRPKRHRHTVNGLEKERIVLGDWDKNLWYIKADEGVLDFYRVPLAEAGSVGTPE